MASLSLKSAPTTIALNGKEIGFQAFQEEYHGVFDCMPSYASIRCISEDQTNW